MDVFLQRDASLATTKKKNIFLFSWWDSRVEAQSARHVQVHMELTADDAAAEEGGDMDGQAEAKELSRLDLVHEELAFDVCPATNRWSRERLLGKSFG